MPGARIETEYFNKSTGEFDLDSKSFMWRSSDDKDYTTKSTIRCNDRKHDVKPGETVFKISGTHFVVCDSDYRRLPSIDDIIKILKGTEGKIKIVSGYDLDDTLNQYIEERNKSL